MGLPSGLLWASCNVGAEEPGEFGLYFSWGNIKGHKEGGYNYSQAVYNSTTGAKITTDLSLSQDAARANLGNPWRMPTAAEFQELNDNCTHVWTKLDGVNGVLFTSNVNGNTLFFPAAGMYDETTINYRGEVGYYWSSTYNSPGGARLLSISSSSVSPQRVASRRLGVCVRAVCNSLMNQAET